MQKKTRQEQQLERLIRLRSDSELAIFDEVQVARDEVEEAKQEVENLREYVDNHLIGPQGEQGIKGDKGDRGEKGDKGDKGKDGRDGRDGRDGMDGIDGQDGENGKDGKDGSPDTAEQIVSKLQTVKSQWLDAKAIKNLPQPVINNYQSFIGRGGGASVGLETIKSSGTIVKQGASTIDFGGGFTVTPSANGVRVDTSASQTSITSSATPTPIISSWRNIFVITALAEDTTFAAPSGTPTNGDTLVIRVEDNGTARSLSWNAIYRASSDLSLPTTTVLGKTLYLGFMYNSTDNKYDLLSVLNNF